MHTVHVYRSDWSFVLTWKTKLPRVFFGKVIAYVTWTVYPGKPGMGLFVSWSTNDFEYNFEKR